jgi:hypothetical protein
MRVKFFLIVALVVFTLPCMEFPEWAGIYDDASNDFVLAPTRTELANNLARRIARPRRSNESPRTLTVAIAPTAIGNIAPIHTLFLPDLINIQRK